MTFTTAIDSLTDDVPTHAAVAPFTSPMHARWPDMDQNGHMRTVAYLEWAEDSRMRFFASVGFPMSAFQDLLVGPVVRSDELNYRAEMRLLDEGTIELRMAGLSDDGARFRMRNTIRRADGRVAAEITSNGGWLHLTERRLVGPPQALLDVLRSLARTNDFESLPDLTPR